MFITTFLPELTAAMNHSCLSAFARYSGMFQTASSNSLKEEQGKKSSRYPDFFSAVLCLHALIFGAVTHAQNSRLTLKCQGETNTCTA